MESAARDAEPLVAVAAAARPRPPWYLYPPSPLTGALFALLGATGPELRAAAGIGYGGLAAIFVAQTIGTIGGAIAVGVSSRPVLGPVPMCVLSALALAGAAATSSASLLMALMLLAGFGCYAVNVRAQSDLSSIAAAARARELGRFHVGGGIGSFLFPLVIAAALGVGASWHVPFAVVAALFAWYALACLGWRSTGSPEPPRRAALRQVARGNAGAALVVACLGTGLQMAVPLWVPTLLHDRFSWTPAQASVVAGAYMFALLVARVAVAWLVPRREARPILVVAATSVVLGHVVIFAAPVSWLFVVGALMVGGGAGPLLPIAIARVNHWSGEDRLGTSVVMSLAGASQIALPAMVVAAHAAGLSLQHAVAVTVFPALWVLAAARRA